ncbi:MAG: hypothetical protein AAB462_00050 [Patescibacteria group bacterium]
MTTVKQALEMPPTHVEEGDGPIDIVGVATYNAGWNHCLDVDQVKEKAIDEAMERLADVVAAPEYTGDYQTALIHHMGRAAFDGFDDLRHSIESAKEIEESKPAQGIIPVILNYTSREDQRRSQSMTAFVAVDPKQPFRSKVIHEIDVQQEGFVAPISVTTRELSLVGQATVINTNLANLGIATDDNIFGDVLRSFDGEFVVRQTTQKDPRNRKRPTGLPPENEFVRGWSPHIRNFDHFIIRNTAMLVGWKEISERLFECIPEQNAGLSYIERVVNFFEQAEQLDALTKQSPDMAKNVALSREIVDRLAELGTPAEKSAD